MNRSALIFSYLTLASAYLFIAVIAFWLFYPYRVVEYTQPDLVENHKVKQGGELVLSVSFCRYMPIVPIISRSFVDGIVYNIPMTVSPTADMGCFKRRVLISIPNSLPVGNYYIATNFRYKVNPVRVIEIVTKSEKFEVIK